MKILRFAQDLRYLFLLFALTLFGQSNAKATDLDIIGNVSYQFSPDETGVILRADQLSNLEFGGLSGTIRLELWAFSQPYSAFASGYPLASYQLGQLHGGDYFYNIDSGYIPFIRPPPGAWYFAVMAREFVGGGTADGFITRDFVNFPDRVFVAGGAFANDVEFFGTSQWILYPNYTVQLQVGQLKNTCDLGITGTLRLDVWASASPYSGGSMNGYRFGSMTLDPLPAGYSYNNLNKNVSYHPPPDGYYYVTMTVSEYIGGAYRILDYLSFPTLKTFGNPPPPLPATPTSLVATKGSLTTGVRLTWNSSAWATSYEIYRSTGNNSSSSTLVAAGITGTSHLDTSATVGITYYYWVKAKNISGKSNFSTGDWGYRNGIAPSVTAQPKAQNGILNHHVTFTVGVSGTAPLSYQWRKDGDAIVGATSASLILANLQLTNAGDYSVHVSNGYGSTTSASVPLVVYDPAQLKALYLQGEDRRLALWYMDGTNFVTSMLLRNGQPVNLGWNLRAFGDFNGDSNTDLVFQHADGRVSTWFMNGPLHVGSATIRTAGQGWRVTGTADINQDEKTDILLRHTDGRLSVWYMDGTSFVSDALFKNGEPIILQWRLGGTADFNGDNQDDLLWHNTDGRVLVWLMNGTELSSTIFLRDGKPTLAGVRLAAVVDIDNNNSADLIWQTPDRRITTWLMQETELLGGLALRNGQPIGSQWKMVGPR